MKSSLITLVGGASTALAAVKGFNYAAQGQTQAKFEASFKAAASLQGANDFTGARLYTMIQEGTTNSPISAIPAAIDTKSTLLLGLWASAPQSQFDNEIAALKSSIQQYGSQLADIVTGISVGSEDLYRISATGIANDPVAVGQTPDQLVSYIQQVRDAIKGTPLASVPIGHVDTWNAYVNSTNNPVIAACDFLGLDEYPYFQTTDPNSIDNAANLFFEAYDKVSAVATGKQIWITEVGWPVSGKVSAQAIPSVDNAQTFWQEVACELEKREVNFWWYMLEDAATPDFSVSKGGQPLYNLACNATSGYKAPTSSASANSTSTGFSTASRTGGSTVTGSASASAADSEPTGPGAVGGSPGAGSQTSGNSASASAGGPSASGSAFAGAAGQVKAGVAGLVMTALVAALAL